MRRPSTNISRVLCIVLPEGFSHNTSIFIYMLFLYVNGEGAIKNVELKRGGGEAKMELFMELCFHRNSYSDVGLHFALYSSRKEI